MSALDEFRSSALRFNPLTGKFFVLHGEHWVDIATVISTGPAVYGVLGSRPAFGVGGRIFVATDENGGQAYLDIVSGWIKIAEPVFSPIGGMSKFVYDIVDGGDSGVAGTHAMRVAAGSRAIPSDAVITGGFIRVTDAAAGTSGGTVALTTGEGAGDLVVSGPFGSAPWSAAGLKAIIPIAGDITKAILTTAQRTPSVVIAVHDLTALAFDLFVNYGLSTPE